MHRCLVFSSLSSWQDRLLIQERVADENVPSQSNNLLLRSTQLGRTRRLPSKKKITPPSQRIMPRTTDPHDLERSEASRLSRQKQNKSMFVQAEQKAFGTQAHRRCTHTHTISNQQNVCESGSWKLKPSHADCYSRWEKQSRKRSRISVDNAISGKHAFHPFPTLLAVVLGVLCWGGHVLKQHPYWKSTGGCPVPACCHCFETSLNYIFFIYCALSVGRHSLFCVQYFTQSKLLFFFFLQTFSFIL